MDDVNKPSSEKRDLFRKRNLIIGTVVILMAILTFQVTVFPYEVQRVPVTSRSASSDALGDTVSTDDQDSRRFAIVSVVPKDQIKAVLEPKFLTIEEEAGSQLLDKELVIGLSINGDHRAYPVPFLSGHEIVNDVVGGLPVVVTW